jgi:hypothetical protein
MKQELLKIFRREDAAMSLYVEDGTYYFVRLSWDGLCEMTVYDSAGKEIGTEWVSSEVSLNAETQGEAETQAEYLFNHLGKCQMDAQFATVFYDEPEEFKGER